MFETESHFGGSGYSPGDDQDDGYDDASEDSSDQDYSNDAVDEDDTQDSERGGISTEDDSTDDGASALAAAPAHEVAAHRNMLGDVLQNLSDSGIDVEELAERAGIDSADIDALSHDDLASLTQYVTQHHPEVVDEVSSRFPAAQGLLGMLSGGGLGRFFGR